MQLFFWSDKVELISDPHKRKRCEVVAAGSCAVGAAAGYALSQRKTEYAKEEAVLDGEIQRTAKFNRAAAEYNRRLSSDIARLERTSKLLKASYVAQRVSESNLVEVKREIMAQLEQSKNAYNDLKRAYDVAVAISEEREKDLNPNDPRLLSLQKEISLLQGNIAELTNGTEQLARINERLSVYVM
jgi:uncharacterized phage infection (PIP) family protein YhgE